MKPLVLLVHLFSLSLTFVRVGYTQETFTLEAEDGNFSGSPQTSIPAYSGSGYVAITDTGTPTVDWTFDSTNAGTYFMTIRFSTPSGEKGFDGTFNGQGFNGMFPAISTWGDYDVGIFEVVNGNNTLQIGGGWHWYNIDKVDLVSATPQPPLPVPATLSDSQASPEALALMANLVADYGTYTWAGQNSLNDNAYILSNTGKLPALLEGDFMDYSPSRVQYGASPDFPTEDYIALAGDGHAIGFGWHWNAPTNLFANGYDWWSGFYTDATTFNVAAALADTNSTEYAMILRDIDAIAAEIQKLSDANIPILWRPLHEASGGWFWWGAQGAEPFKELWRLVYDRLTVYHDLHNMIWVLTNEDPAWYPGDDVVDIIGVDSYPADISDSLQANWQALKSQFDGNKLIALTEFGGVPDVEKMHDVGVWFSYFACWTGFVDATPVGQLNQTYNSPEVITLDEMNPILPAPTGLVATAVSSSQIDLSWSAAAGADSYNIKRSLSSGGSYITVATNNASTVYSDSGLSENTMYHYVVTAIYSGTESGNSDEASAATHGPYPVDETTISGSVSGSYADTHTSDNIYEQITEVESGGNPPNQRYSFLEHMWVIDIGSSGYPVLYVEAYHSSNSEGDDFVFAWSTNQVDFTDALTVTKTSDNNTAQSEVLPSGLAGTIYIRVRDTDQTQNNKALDSLFVDELYISSEPPVAAVPSGLIAASGDSQITLSWNDATNALSYNVKRSLVSGGPYTVIGMPSVTNFVDDGLMNGTSYYYVVSAIGAGGESSNSVETNAIPSIAIAPEEYLFSSCSIVEGTNVSLTVSNSVLGHLYQIKASDSMMLPPALWQPEGIALEGNAATLQFDIPILTIHTNRFFKLDIQRQ